MTAEDWAAVLEPYLIRHESPAREVYHSVKEAGLIELACKQDRPLKQIMVECLKQGLWPERFRPQRGTFTPAEQARLLESTVAQIGAGGLGGAVCLLLARIGVGRLIVCDGDVFDESNLNRQLLSRLDRLGRPKAVCAAEEIKGFSSFTQVDVHTEWATEENLPRILDTAQVVVDCLDNIPTRLLLQKAARDKGIPFIHGAIAGQEGFILTVLPEDPGLETLYGSVPAGKGNSAESFLGTPTIAPAVTAGLQATEAINILLDRPPACRRKLRHLDLASMDLVAMNIGADQLG